jgi:peptide-methionine (S)-S-oxide reductase
MSQALSTRDIYEKAISGSGYGSIVTEIAPSEGITYFLAEEYHQKYLLKNPKGYDCHSSTGIAFPKQELTQ